MALPYGSPEYMKGIPYGSKSSRHVERKNGIAAAEEQN
jgi:hypothetical protein